MLYNLFLHPISKSSSYITRNDEEFFQASSSSTIQNDKVSVSVVKDLCDMEVPLNTFICPIVAINFSSHIKQRIHVLKQFTVLD